MGNFLAELKRRHIYRIGAAYMVVAWLALQIVNNVAPVLDLPPWVARAILLLLVIGFPFSLLLAWIVEEPQRSRQKSKSAHIGAADGHVDWVLVGALVVVIAIFTYQQFALSPTKLAQRVGAGATFTAVSKPTGNSVAVLPFGNLSGDANQEFFSDGMTDEIMTALAKVPALRVVGRESAFQFKGEKKDMRAVGQALNAQYLIDGSVRKAGDQVRITAQLVRADDGLSVWTDSYDRDLKNIFATQSDIAAAIASALRVPLGLQQREALVSNRTIETESYQDFLRAKAMFRARISGGAKPLTEPIALLERVVSDDPSYAPAWALLALAYVDVPIYDPISNGSATELRRIVDSSLERAETAARRAIQSNPRNADGYAVLGTLQSARGKLLAAEDLYKQALMLDPLDSDTLHEYSNLVAGLGHLKQAVAMRERVRELEPLVPQFNSNTARILWANEQTDAATEVNESLPTDYPYRWINLARIYASLGRYSEAADALMAMPSGGIGAQRSIEAAASLLRTAAAKSTSLQAIPPNLGRLAFVHLYSGVPERALEFVERNVEAGYEVQITNAELWHPSYAPVRKTERFKDYIRKAGLVDYWKARGWPDLCHPTTGDDFECD